MRRQNRGLLRDGRAKQTNVIDLKAIRLTADCTHANKCFNAFATLQRGALEPPVLHQPSARSAIAEHLNGIPGWGGRLNNVESSPNIS